MKVEFSHNFIKMSKKRFKNKPRIKNKFFQKTRLFAKNPLDKSLKNHPLKGTKKGLNAFSITGDIRVIYQIKNNTAYFLDIGTHNQVY